MFEKIVCTPRNICTAMLAFFLVAALPAKPAVAVSSQYPERNIEIVVAYPAGGAIDTLARLIGSELGQSFRRLWRHWNQYGCKSET
jgi:tripartite-type tricarboxylate transporter receptor subunit TctC